ncbi:MAG: RluA family pseudouridine synthase [Planctomycetes bacterium]|jgi:23S rRNA pseudouridine1911/1915/1917 synthase|nr:RluA family pseudouridine synthase [Planctomycetota bacterium]
MTTRSASSGQGEVRRLVVPIAAEGERLDRFLVAAFPELSRTRLQELVRGGAVRVAGEPALRSSRLLVADEVVEIEFAPPSVARDEDFGDLELSVVYEDEWFAIVDKPAGLLSHPGNHTVGPSVSGLARKRWGELPALQGEDRPGIVHRLDVGTSGLMVIGREQAAFEHLLAQFRERQVEKTYYAIVHREPRFDTGWIEAPIGRSPRHPDRMSVVPAGEGREAATYYEVLERFEGFGYLACRPKTGRTHQIRVHLAHVDHPLVADPLYRRAGPHAAKLAADAPVPTRQALHAGGLVLTHPKSGERLTFESPLPADLAALLAWLRAHHAKK